MIDRNAVKLDPRESHYWIPSHHAGLLLFLRHLAPEDGGRGDRIVLYVHGATFPSALSIAHRLDLDCDPQSRTRRPAAVQVPSGALQDILDAWAGGLGYDPALIRAPVSIVRGEWDSLVTDGRCPLAVRRAPWCGREMGCENLQGHAPDAFGAESICALSRGGMLSSGARPAGADRRYENG
jgi:hypothetical protein